LRSGRYARGDESFVLVVGFTNGSALIKGFALDIPCTAGLGSDFDFQLSTY